MGKPLVCFFFPFSENTYCPVCQKDCREKVNFCQHCGTRVNVNLNLREDSVSEQSSQAQSRTSAGMNEMTKTNFTERDSSSVENSWLCGNCTFLNSNMKSELCEMCYRTTNSVITVKGDT